MTTPRHDRGSQPFSERALSYFAAHAIDPRIAESAGVRERAGALVYPYADTEGTYRRTRSLTDNAAKRTLQPAGRALTCWWPAGRPTQAEAVLVCEGEPDTLAALSALARAGRLNDVPRGLLQPLTVLGVPGTGFTIARLVAELQAVGAKRVALAPDGDAAGDKFAARAADALSRAGLEVCRLALPPEKDLADCMAAAEDAAEWLAGAIADAEAQAEEHRSSTAAGDAPAPWPPLPGTRPTFPLEALPAAVRAFIEAVAEETQTPADLAALAALGVLSAAALGPIEVDCGVWREESLGLYILVAMPSGDHKSTVLKTALAPLRAIERELQQRSAPARRRTETRREILTGRKATLTRTAAAARDPESRKVAEAEVTEVDDELDKLGEPVAPRMLANDATAEALGGLLAKHGRIAVIAAEAPLIDNLTGRYSEKGAANLHLVCGAYNGEATQIDRRGRDAELLERPLMSMTFTVQPHVLDGLVNHETARRQGFVGRFALVLPETRLGRRRTDVTRAPAHVHESWEHVVRSVSTANPLTELTELADSDDCREDSGSSVSSVSNSLSSCSELLLLLSLSPEARELLTELRDELEPRLKADGDLFPIADWVARHHGRIVRYAGILHLAQGLAGNAISAETMRGALLIGEYLLEHALAALTLHDEGNRRALAWLSRCDTAVVTQREIHRGLLGSRGSADDAKRLCLELVRLGALRAIAAGRRMPGEHRSPVYEINPSVRGDAPRGPREEWWDALITAGLPEAYEQAESTLGNGNGNGHP